jgi:hypothetical protein
MTQKVTQKLHLEWKEYSEDDWKLCGGSSPRATKKIYTLPY